MPSPNQKHLAVIEKLVKDAVEHDEVLLVVHVERSGMINWQTINTEARDASEALYGAVAKLLELSRKRSVN